MNEEDKKKLKSEALDFLRTHKIAIIATASVEGEPQAAVIYYVIDDDFNIYFITDPNSKKSKNIAANKKVAIVIGAGPNISTVQGGGIIDESDSSLTTLDIIKKISEKLSDSEKRYWPIVKLGESMTGWRAFKIKLDWLTWLNLDIVNSPANLYKEGFHQILP